MAVFHIDSIIVRAKKPTNDLATHYYTKDAHNTVPFRPHPTEIDHSGQEINHEHHQTED